MVFGKRTRCPKPVLTTILSSPAKAQDFVSFQPFALDTLLISVKTNKVIDIHGAISDIENKVIKTVGPPEEILSKRPFLAIRVAALVAETGFSPTKGILDAISNNKNKLEQGGYKNTWKELKRLLRADKPSRGIEFLREVGILKTILPELEDCYGVEQNTLYHKYTVYEHCLLACDCCDRKDVRLRLAALIHDIGKPTTAGKNERGVTFHKHEVESTKLARTIMARFGLKRRDSIFIVSLVQNHMYQYDRKWKDTTVRKFIKRVGLTQNFIGRLRDFPLFKLRNADRMGRDLPPITQKQRDFESRLENMLNYKG